MEWNIDTSLKLIELYQENRCLWDPQFELYKNNNKKEDAWAIIATIMNCTVFDVKKKMDSLLASYRRERQKSLQPKSGSGADAVYKSKWFAYNNMKFLLGKYKPRNTVNTETQPNLVECVDQEVTEEFQKENQHIGAASTSSQHKKFKSLPKTSKKKVDSRSDYAYNVLKETVLQRSTKDASSVFGEYVATKHRTYSTYVKNTVEHLITNILYDADMGKYNNSSSTPCLSPYQSSTTSSIQCQSPMPSPSTMEHQPYQSQSEYQALTSINNSYLLLNTFSQESTN